MKRAITSHLRDFVAIIALVAVAVGAGGYILSNQRLRFPFVEEKPFAVWVELQNAQAVTPGQGQTVRVSGMRVGDIGEVKLREGRALVRMDLDQKHKTLVRRDATVLLRPRTGLKDMFLQLDPGSPTQPALKENDTIPISRSAPDVNPDEILAMLDADTRDYLKLLISGAGKGLRGRSDDLREVFRRLGPLHRDIARLNRLVATRRRNLQRMIHNFGSTMERLGREDEALSELVTSSSAVFDRLAEQDQQISLAVRRLPSALSQTEATLRRVRELGEVAGPAFAALRPAVRQIDETNRELLPTAVQSEPVVRTQIRPLVRVAQPYVRTLRPAARNLGNAQPDLRESFYELNRFFNQLAYNPNGREALTGNAARDLSRDEGFLFWLGWISHNTTSLISTSDAQGPFRRSMVALSCTTINGLSTQQPGLESILGFTSVLNDDELCPD
jgi:phospholipid/cholesterol/gamma-HCH transport system substrate-binding protein